MASAKGYFVAGTDTEIGKTLVACALIHRLVQQGCYVAGMKPVASGADAIAGQWRNEDVEQLLAVSNCKLEREQHNPYLFEPAIAPHLAAQQQGREIRLAPIIQAFQALTEQAQVTIVEAAGGVLVPLGKRLSMVHLIQAMDLPVVLVIGLRLGCLNHALLSQEALLGRGIKIAGWVANQVDPQMQRVQDNLAVLRASLSAPELGYIPYMHTLDIGQAASYLNMSVLEQSSP